MKRFVVVVAVALAATACDENLRDLAGPTPDLEPTLSAIQRDIFDAPDATGRPACTSCHNAQNARFAGNLNLVGTNAHAQLVNVPSSGKAGATRVIPGDPDNSYLIHKLEGGPDIVGLRMPRPSGPFLTPGQLLIIRTWIRQGAQDN